VGPAAPAPEGALSTPTRVDMLLTHDFLYFLIENFSPPQTGTLKNLSKSLDNAQKAGATILTMMFNVFMTDLN